MLSGGVALPRVIGPLLTLVGFCLCGNSRADIDPDPILTTAERSVEVGHGILAPNRLVASASEDVLYVATGRGESYSEGYLHALDARTLKELGRPLEVGRNVNDLVSFGGQLLAVSRGDSTVALIDPVRWVERDRIDVGFQPTAAAALSTTTAAVAGITTNQLVVVSQEDGRLQVERRKTMPGLVGDLAVSRRDQVLYVSVSGVGVVAFDIATLTEVGRAPIAGPLGKGAMVWKGYVVVSDRDGYVHFVNRTTFAVTSIDVAESLGLDRGELPVRGIDCSEVLSLGRNRVAVLNVRQDGVIYRVDPDGPTFTAIARLPEGGFGTYLEGDRRIIETRPASNEILDVRIPATIPASGQLEARRVVTGVGIQAAQLLNGTNAGIAALDTLGSLHVLGASPEGDRLLGPREGLRWRPPLVAGPGGTIGLFESDDKEVRRFVFVDREGVEVRGFPVEVPDLFSAAVGDGTLALVARLNHAVQLIDLSTGSSRIVPLEHDRPRFAAPIGNHRWLVFHDTVPDIGWTLLRDDGSAEFSRRGTWVTGAVPLSNRQIATVSFKGVVGVMNLDGSYEREVDTGMNGATDIEKGLGKDLWITSRSLGEACQLTLDTLEPRLCYERYGLSLVGALNAVFRYAIVTTRKLEIARLVVGHPQPGLPTP